jgi:hypothetical protein
MWGVLQLFFNNVIFENYEKNINLKGKKPNQLKTKLLALTGAQNKEMITKIWTDINPPSYLRPELPRLKLSRLVRDL